MKPIYHNIILVLFPLFLLFLISCDSNRVYEKNIGISDGNWDIEEKLAFDVQIDDTVSQHNFYINLRNTGSYPNSNIFLFINTEFPDGGKSRDTVECFLADVNGKWLGKGSGDLWENQILFKRGVIFPKPGIYKFEFEQAMRMEQVPFIIDAGLRIEKKDAAF